MFMKNDLKQKYSYDKYITTLLLIMIGLFIYLSFMHVNQFILINGHPWVQGDWLINSTETEVRRGLLGSFIIATATYLQLNPIHFLIGLQILSFIACLGIILYLVFKRISLPYAYVVVLSPLFFLNFWAFSIISSFRKEILIYLAFALLFFSQKHRYFLYASLIILLLALAGHEMTLFFMPIYFLVLFFLTGRDYIVDHYKSIIFSLIIAFSLVLYAFIYRHASSEMVCMPLQRLVEPDFCVGNTAIGWLDKDFSYAWAQMKQKIFSHSALHTFFLAYLLSFTNLYYLSRIYNAQRDFILCFCASLICISPLFILGYDWGRWVSIQYMLCSFLLLSLWSKKEIQLELKVKSHYFILLILIMFSLAVHFNHRVDIEIFIGMKN